MKQYFIGSVLAKARDSCTVEAVIGGIEMAFDWSTRDQKRRRRIGPRGSGTLTALEGQLGEIDSLCRTLNGRGNDTRPEKAREFIVRYVGVDYDHETQYNFLGIAPALWTEVRNTIYEFVVEARNPKSAQYVSILGTKKKPSALASVLRTWGSVEAWRPDWEFGEGQRYCAVQTDLWVSKRLTCTREQANIATTLYKRLPEDAQLQVPGAKFCLSKGDLARLAETRTTTTDAWLNDEVINGFQVLLQRREDIRANMAFASGEPCDRTVFLPTSLYAHMLLACGGDKSNSLTETAFRHNRGIAKVKIDVDCVRLVLVCNDNPSAGHWEVVEVDFRNQYIRHYCPMGNRNEFMMQRVWQWLTLITRYRYWGLAQCVRGMKFEHVRHCAAQRNGVDCGVFSLAIMDFIALGLPVERIAQTAMAALRKKYMWEIFAGAVALPHTEDGLLSPAHKAKLDKQLTQQGGVIDLCDSEDEAEAKNDEKHHESRVRGAPLAPSCIVSGGSSGGEGSNGGGSSSEGNV
jgi:hypothetical protein